MKKINNKKTIIILLVLCIGAIDITIAYFSNSTVLDNLFSIKPYGTTYIETFVSPDNWLPGDTTDKTIIVTNSGSVDEAVRISYTEAWKSNNGTTLSGLIDEKVLLTDIEENCDKAAIINFSNTDDWTYNNGYEIGRDNEDNNVGTISYYKSNDCYYNSDYDKNTTGCSSNYDTSNIKNVIDNWSNTFNDVLEEINGYKARLITYDEIMNIGYSNVMHGTQYYLEVSNDTKCSGFKTWYNGGSIVPTISRYTYISQLSPVRPVINLKKCAITNTCE